MHKKHRARFFIYRNTDLQLIKNIMNSIEWDANDESKDLSKADKLTAQQLQAMQAVARMKEAADKCGAGFVGGFISPTGERFMMSNMEADDIQYQSIMEKLQVIQTERLNEMHRMLDEFEG